MQQSPNCALFVCRFDHRRGQCLHLSIPVCRIDQEYIIIQLSTDGRETGIDALAVGYIYMYADYTTKLQSLRSRSINCAGS